MLKIKLQLRGKKHQRTYRIVIAESRSKSEGKFVDELGYYTPQTKKLDIDQTKLADWQKKGAQVTLGVDRLLHPDQHPNKPKKVKVKAATPTT
jgi:small subunit ribosomal protein S16